MGWLGASLFENIFFATPTSLLPTFAFELGLSLGPIVCNRARLWAIRFQSPRHFMDSSASLKEPKNCISARATAFNFGLGWASPRHLPPISRGCCRLAQPTTPSAVRPLPLAAVAPVRPMLTGAV